MEEESMCALREDQSATYVHSGVGSVHAFSNDLAVAHEHASDGGLIRFESQFCLCAPDQILAQAQESWPEPLLVWRWVQYFELSVN